MQQRAVFAANQLVFSEGDRGDFAYLIEKGQVLVFVVRDGTEIPIRVIGEGEVFGEMSLIDDEPRAASCRTLEECQFIRVSREHLQERIKAADPIVRLLVRVFLERLRSQTEIIVGEDAIHRAHKTGKITQDQKEALERIGLEHKIAEAIEADEFVPFFQPVYSLPDRKLRGSEALIRWRRSDGSYVSPLIFIEAMESSSLILDAGRAMLDKSMAALTLMQGMMKTDKPLFVSINVSGRQFMHEGFVANLEQLRKKHAVDAGQIKLEITERIMMEGERALEVLRECRRLGYGLAIDDFGTGFSSLQYLSKMPLTDIKIDRSFATQVQEDPKIAAVVKAIVAMARDLNLHITAEGMETEAQLAPKNFIGVDYAQGYLFSKPLPIEQFLKIPT
ncbi:MAG: EAL domain-containing protein [Bdellovibrionaceae bacterium]|nr:EAL domain-containing protein [Pseudobdellovibrionaceae bacterium]